MCHHPHIELPRIPRLHEHSSRTREFADQSFSAAYTRNDTTARYTLHDIFAIPSHEVTIVDDVLLTFDELYSPLTTNCN